MSKPKRSFRELRDDLAAQVESFRKWRESATDREEELLFESLAKFYPDLYEAADAGRRARGEPPIQDLEKIAKWRTHYEKAYYGKLRHSKKGREAVDFLRRLRMKCLFVAERVCGASDSEQGYERQLLEACEETFTLLEPLLNALPSRDNPDQLDVEFLKALAEAGDFLERRLVSCKQAEIGSGDLHLDKWLLEYSLGLPSTGNSRKV